MGTQAYYLRRLDQNMIEFLRKESDPGFHLTFTKFSHQLSKLLLYAYETPLDITLATSLAACVLLAETCQYIMSSTASRRRVSRIYVQEALLSPNIRKVFPQLFRASKCAIRLEMPNN